MKNANKWFLVTIAALGLLLLIAGKNSIIAQTAEPTADFQVKCRTFAGLLSSWPPVTYQGEIQDDWWFPYTDRQGNQLSVVVGQCRYDFEWAAIDAPGLGPENVLSVSMPYPGSPDDIILWSPPGSYNFVTDFSRVAIGEGKAYVQRKRTTYTRGREPVYDSECYVSGFTDWSAWSSYVDDLSGPYKFNVFYMENLVVENPGSGKALNLDWQNIVPGGGVAGYRVYRRELPAE